MDWTDEPATWKQLKFLKEHGWALGHRLTKIEAAGLIRGLGGEPEAVRPAVANALQEAAPRAAYQLHVRAEKARRALTDARSDSGEKLEHELAAAVAERQAFWIDSCRGAGNQLESARQVHELYQKHGCRFDVPGGREVQFILDALDGAMSLWDRDHPELFYQTLELNFPVLLRRS